MQTTLFSKGPAPAACSASALPALSLGLPQLSATPLEDPNAPRRPRVLVVEDDEDIMRCLSIRLKINGFDVSEAGNLQDALDLASECDPDVAIFDVSFPGGDGMQLTQQLRANPTTAHLPVMVLTASMRPGIQEEAFAAGANGFMRKPYNADALIDELSGWCKPSETSSESARD